MSYTLSASVQARLDVTESADATTSPASGGTQGNARQFAEFSKNYALGASTYPPISGRVIDFSRTLAAADEDVDLTAAKTAADVAETVDMTGKKLVALILWAPKSNAGTIKLHQSGANDYSFNGGEDIVLQKGERLVKFLDGEGDSAYANPYAAVAAGAKIIRVSGTVGDKLWAMAVMGT